MDVESTSDRYHTRTITPVKGDTVLYSIDGNKVYQLGTVREVKGRFTLLLGIDKTIHTVYSRDCIVIHASL